MATAAEDDNWAIISTGLFWEWRQKNYYKRVGLDQFNTRQIIFHFFQALHQYPTNLTKLIVNTADWK